MLFSCKHSPNTKLAVIQGQLSSIIIFSEPKALHSNNHSNVCLNDINII